MPRAEGAGASHTQRVPYLPPSLKSSAHSRALPSLVRSDTPACGCTPEMREGSVRVADMPSGLGPLPRPCGCSGRGSHNIPHGCCTWPSSSCCHRPGGFGSAQHSRPEGRQGALRLPWVPTAGSPSPPYTARPSTAASTLTISSPHLAPVGTSLSLATTSLASLLAMTALHLKRPKKRE